MTTADEGLMEKPTTNAKTALVVATKEILHRMLCPCGRCEEQPHWRGQAAPLELEIRLWLDTKNRRLLTEPVVN